MLEGARGRHSRKGGLRSAGDERREEQGRDEKNSGEVLVDMPGVNVIFFCLVCSIAVRHAVFTQRCPVRDPSSAADL